MCLCWLLILVRIVLSPSQSPIVAGIVCNYFPPAMDEYPRSLCSSCWEKAYNVDVRYSDCHDWADETWSKVSPYREKLALQQEKERKAKSFIFLFFSFSCNALPVPLSWPSTSFDSEGITTSIASSIVCAVTFSTLSPIELVQPIVSPNPVSDSGELSRKRKRKRECSGLSSDVFRYQIWAEFQHLIPVCPGVVTPVLHRIFPGLLLPFPVRLAIGHSGETSLLYLATGLASPT